LKATHSIVVDSRLENLGNITTETFPSDHAAVITRFNWRHIYLRKQGFCNSIQGLLHMSEIWSHFWSHSYFEPFNFDLMEAR